VVAVSDRADHAFVTQRVPRLGLSQFWNSDLDKTPPIAICIDPMQRIGDWAIIIVLLALAGYFFHAAPAHPPIEVDEPLPLAIAEPIAGLSGDGRNFLQTYGPFNTVPWWRERVAALPDATNAPDGSKTAARLVETRDFGRHRVGENLNAIAPGQVQTLSLYVKPAERWALQFEMADTVSKNYGIARFDLRKKVVIAEIGDVTDAGIQEVHNGWYRCWAAMPYASKTGGVNFGLMDREGQVDYRGDSNAGLFIWGPQFGLGAAPRG